MQQRLAEGGGDGEEEPQAKMPKTNESCEMTLIYFAQTNSETEREGRNNHILMRCPAGLAAALVAGIDQTVIGSIQGQHLGKISVYKTNKHKGMTSFKQLNNFARGMNARMQRLGDDPRNLGDINDAQEFIDSIPLYLRRRFWPSGGRRALTRAWRKDRRRSATSRRLPPRPSTARRRRRSPRPPCRCSPRPPSRRRPRPPCGCSPRPPCRRRRAPTKRPRRLCHQRSSR